MNTRVWRLLTCITLSLLILFIAGCGRPAGVDSNEEKTVTGDSAADPAQGENTEDTGNTVPSKVSPGENSSLVKKIVDGYDITAATTGTKLKDAYAEYFTIGAAINGSQPSNSTIRSAAMSEILKYHFNSTTFSNLMKPSYLLNQQESMKNFRNGVFTPAVDFSSVTGGLNFARDNGIQMRGHTLVWHNQVPDWFFREGYSDSGAYVDKDTMLMRLESYIQQVLEYHQSAYPGVIYCWDVVNEAVENTAGSYETQSGLEIRTRYDGGENLWYRVIGSDYVEKAFEYARKYAASDVKLIYNDYNTFQPDKTQSIYDLVSLLKEKGLVDGIGMQSYMDLAYPGIQSGTHNVKKAIEKFAELGLEIQMTELTMRSRDKTEQSFKLQAERYKELFTLYTELDTAGGGPANITNVTFFGLMDEYLFYPDNTEYHRIFDGKLQPKPAFFSILSVVE
jgi:endo-1,4-beta-xylanase